MPDEKVFRIGYADENVTDFPHSCEKSDIDWVATFVLCTVADILKLKPVFVRSPTGNFGNCPLEAGKCTGLLEMLQNGEIDAVKGMFQLWRRGHKCFAYYPSEKNGQLCCIY